MTRHPARHNGEKARAGRRDQSVGWRWYCDQPKCRNATAIIPGGQGDLPSPEEMRAAGWFVAKLWGDICPVCLAAGVVPPTEDAPEPVVAAGSGGEEGL